MSAFLCNKSHFDVVTSYFVGDYRDGGLWLEVNGEYGYLTKENAGVVASILYNENIRSLASRYGAEGSSYEFNYIPSARSNYSALEIAGALDCLEYQSCESDDYNSTQAYSILCLMRKHLLNELQPEEKTWEIAEVKKSTRLTLGVN